MGMESVCRSGQRAVSRLHGGGLEDVEFRLPFKFFRMQPATLHLTATGCPGDDDGVVVRLELRSVVRPKPDLPAQERVHFVAHARLTEQPPGKLSVAFEPPPPGVFAIGRDRIYQLFFHGPAYQVLEGRAPVRRAGRWLDVETSCRPTRRRRRRRRSWRRA